jgi:hypothetical protein
VWFVVALQVWQVATVEGHGRVILSQGGRSTIGIVMRKRALIPKQERVGADALVRLRWKYAVLYGGAGAKNRAEARPRTKASGAT